MKIDHDKIINAASEILRKAAVAEKRWDWDPSKPHSTGPKQAKLQHDRDRTILWLRVMDYWPSKKKPDGWALLWHKWNKGFTLSYVCPQLGWHEEEIVTENATTIRVDYFRVRDNPTFWQRVFPKGFSFTIAKLGHRWRMNRHKDPFMMASLEAAPLISAEDWAKLQDPQGIIEK